MLLVTELAVIPLANPDNEIGGLVYHLYMGLRLFDLNRQFTGE